MNALPPISARRTFPHTSVVATLRGPRRKLCGYEVWRHLYTGGLDPTRKKARLWFGRRRHGGARRARQLAYYAAATMSRMTPRELREWWSEYTAARAARRTPSNLWRDEQRYVDRADFLELAQMSHRYELR